MLSQVKGDILPRVVVYFKFNIVGVLGQFVAYLMKAMVQWVSRDWVAVQAREFVQHQPIEGLC